MKNIKKKPFKRLNLYMNSDLYNEVKQKAEDAYLPIATWTRQFILRHLQQENNLKLKRSVNDDGTNNDSGLLELDKAQRIERVNDENEGLKSSNNIKLKKN